MRILLASEEMRWGANFVHGYTSLGCQVTASLRQFKEEDGSFDLVHMNWPEEFRDWDVGNEPTVQESAGIGELLSRWKSRAKLVFSVNNLYPHGCADSAGWKAYYRKSYEQADIIHHFSHTSVREFLRTYPELSDKRHLVTVGFNYERLLKPSIPERSLLREQFGAKENEFVYLVFGAIRSHSELRLLSDAFRRVKVPGKRLFTACHFAPCENKTRLQHILSSLKWHGWIARYNPIRVTAYIEDEALQELFAAVDSVVSLRQESLSSGIPCLAMTFGTPVIAADVGAAKEYLSDCGNFLYKAGDPTSLARAMSLAPKADLVAVRRRNQDLALERSWKAIADQCLKAVFSI